MAAAYLELNRVEHDRICRSGLQVALEHTRKTTVELQAIEIEAMKRKLDQMEDGLDHLREHCFDLCGRVDGLQEDLRLARTGIQEVLGSALKVLKMVEGNKDCTEEVEKIISGLASVEVEIVVDSDDEADEQSNSGSEDVSFGGIDTGELNIQTLVVL